MVIWAPPAVEEKAYSPVEEEDEAQGHAGFQGRGLARRVQDF